MSHCQIIKNYKIFKLSDTIFRGLLEQSIDHCFGMCQRMVKVLLFSSRVISELKAFAKLSIFLFQ